MHGEDPDAPPDTVIRLVQTTPQRELPPVLAGASLAQIEQAS